MQYGEDELYEEVKDTFQQHSQLTIWYCSKLTTTLLSIPQHSLPKYSRIDGPVIKPAKGGR